ncbi:hypothetical protein G7Z17_g8572 [Cylindrodendrum hubeiense]|uniref:Uncharacterized protein n=1 Tax=Cylindrodendrum hubeiense TaxID=595255 RepID=A0A9P5L6E0_9HYPO|nr:hypothetical protein G7Z17_g8572 [Cylindrodendrum hubeiense]
MKLNVLLAALAAGPIPLASATPLVQISIAESLAPSIEVAAQRGPHLFNAVFDSLRKWGAVTHRNGMSFMLATVPKNVLLYHGNNHNSTPTTLDWLAYELEHAEMFARPNWLGPHPRRPGYGPGHGYGHGHDDSNDDNNDDNNDEVESVRQDLKRRGIKQDPLADSDDVPLESPETGHGWLHIYRTTRPLRFLYVDGMSGDKDNMGVLDSQDFLLRGVRDEHGWPPRRPPHDEEELPGIPGEQNRVRDLCQLCADWNLQGLIRTEWVGFEIIKCDFFDGLDQVQSLQRDDTNPDQPPWFPEPGKPRRPEMPGTRRDLEDRFRAVNPGRTILDYSSLMSAFFFPINITNPDNEHPKSPRLLSTTEDELATVKEYMSNIVQQRHDAPITLYNWRHVADEIVQRYTPKIFSILNNTNSVDDIAKDIRFLLEAFIDYSIKDETVRDKDAEKRCVAFYIQTLPLETDADHLLYSAFEAVNAEICASFFRIRAIIVGDPDADDKSIEESKSILKSLIEYLAWHVFE